MAALGIALVVMILFILFGLVGGLRTTVMRSGSANNWILLGAGAESELVSRISKESYDILCVRPEFATDSSGAPLISVSNIIILRSCCSGRPPNWEPRREASAPRSLGYSF
ncbi:MAG TPA: hypothetical protein VIX12_00560 [Candidatus Binataceae bacterium]